MRNDAGILIAASDEDRSLLIERTLFRAGLSNQTLRLGDGQAALDFLTRLKDSDNPHSKQAWMMLLDLELPDVGGLEVLKAIKSDSFLKVIPVIMMTSSCSDDVLAQCHEAGCNIILTGPVESELLAETLTGVGHFLSVVEIPALRTQ